MLELFKKGGPVMWPLLVTSLVAMTVAFERLIFIIRERSKRDPSLVEKILTEVEKGDPDAAVRAGQGSGDFVVRTLVYGLRHREKTFSNALLQAANKELKRFNHGLSVLDTIITLAPLLGLFGTVTGMIHAFGLLGGSELGAPTAITGGIAEALIATAYGLVIAIVALIPFNYLNTRVEEARHEIEDASTHLELHLSRAGK
ncbi:MAG TPA: MotA/TolQ/ExbB proton channel family protein [Candidatus Omnitrophota bacterium]|nr:MotA/TolQ/ExbB proton channel family protein [Candidatus Omnitrophota bacterium]